MKKKVVILTDVAENVSTLTDDERDTWREVAAVYTSLVNNGHAVEIVPFTVAFEALDRRVRSAAPDIVVNLVENSTLIVLAPLFLEIYGYRFTGAGSAATHYTNDKLLFHKLFYRYFRHENVSMPEVVRRINDAARFRAGRYIIKAKDLHASIGLDGSSVLDAGTYEELSAAIAQKSVHMGSEFFAQEFIDGRECNIAFLNGEILPPAEIQFRGFAENQPRIVGYEAKWDDTRPEYHNTVRVFIDPQKEGALIDILKKTTKQVLDMCGVTTYARVDYRVVGMTPYVLEVNTNPCISPDAGFAAAAERAGYTYDEMIMQIIQGG